MITYVTAVANGRLGVVVAALDAGDGPGKLQIGTTSMGAVLVEVDLDENADITERVLTLLAEGATAQASGSGVAAAARLVDSDDNVVASGLTVGLSGSGADVIVDSTSITEGQNVTVVSATITHP